MSDAETTASRPLDRSKWPIVPLSVGQSRDVREEDILEGGLYRRCNTYRGGGGYDLFPSYAEKRWGKALAHQFVVQLRGCNLDCFYCYVTRAGVWGEPIFRTSQEIWKAFRRTDQEILHLMGGAPALYLRHWPELLSLVEPPYVFHSDLMLTERDYDPGLLREIVSPQALYAVNIKGLTPEEHLRMTRRPLNEARRQRNLERLNTTGVPYYVTFTGIARDDANKWAEKNLPEGIDYYVIDLIDYDALPFVDGTPWGARDEQTTP